MPRFSIVIPVYNGAKYLEECLNSFVAQTFTDFEVICINDASTDNSLSILREFESRDSRFVVIDQTENTGSARARRKGVLASQGDYILFCDQDDSYVHDALWKINMPLLREAKDVFQYGVKVVNDGNVPQEEMDGLKKWMEPFPAPLEGREILDACFKENKFGYSIWNKAYRGEMARKVFALTPDEPITLGEDNYESFVLFYSAKTFASTPYELYVYHYGRGYTGNTSNSVKNYERTCGLIDAAELIRRFLIDQNTFKEYEDTYLCAREHMLEYALNCWKNEVAQEEKTQALKKLIEHWPYGEVLDAVKKWHPEAMARLFSARFDKASVMAIAASDEKAQEFLDAWNKAEALCAEYEQFQEQLKAELDALRQSKQFKRGNSLVCKLKRSK